VGRWGPAHFELGGVAYPLETCSSTPVTEPNLAILGQMFTSIIMEICQKNLTFASDLSRSLKVTGNDTNQLATGDFLLEFHSNYGPIPYRFRRKLPLSHPVYLMPPLRVSPGILDSKN